MKNEKHFGLRIDAELLHKLHYVSDYEGRSVNSQILFLIRKCVSAFESRHGRIDG